MARIPYLIRPGGFLAGFADFIVNHAAYILAGRKCILDLGYKNEGWGGNYMALIVPPSHNDYPTSFPHNDWTTAPARLRSFSTALRNCNLLHIFWLKYDKSQGQITVMRIDRPTTGQTTSIIVPEIDATRDPDQWWHHFQDFLNQALIAGRQFSRVVFRGNGNIQIPDWFKEWCLSRNIEIEILPEDEFDGMYEQEEPVVEIIHE